MDMKPNSALPSTTPATLMWKTPAHTLCISLLTLFLMWNNDNWKSSGHTKNKHASTAADTAAICPYLLSAELKHKPSAPNMDSLKRLNHS